MSTKNKIIIALGVIGLVLLCVGSILGGSLSSIPAIFSEVTLPEGAISAEEAKPADVHSLELNLVNSDITIKTGEDFRLSGSGLSASYVKDGVLYAGKTEAKHTANIFGSKLSAPKDWIYGHGTYVLTIPPKAKFDSIKIQAAHCDIVADSLKATTIDLVAKSGNVTVTEIATDTLNISAKSLSTENIQVLQNATINTSKNITIGNEAMMANVLQNVTLTSSRGDITTFGKFMGNSSISAERGNIATTLAGASTNYTMRPLGGELTIGTEVGAEVSEEHFGDISFTSKTQSDVHFK